ncbi:MAG: glycosyltransferase, partial [Myxococcota bacterium]
FPAPHLQPRRFMATGPLEHAQGFDLLLDAFAQAVPQMRRAELTIYGDGSEREALRAQAETLRVASRVQFVPAQGLEAFRQALGQTDVVTLPARKAGLPMVVLEALAARRPMIVSDAGDLSEVVRTYGVGTIVNRGDTDALADALWRSYHRGFSISPQAFVRAEEELSLDTSVERWDTILQDVLTQRPRG